MVDSAKRLVLRIAWGVFLMKIGLSLLSGGMTGYGVYGLLEANFTAEIRVYLSAATVFAVILIQGGLLIGGKWFLEPTNIWGKLLAGSIFLFSITLSIIPASGSWSLTLDPDAVLHEENRIRSIPLRLSLETFQKGARGAALEMRLISSAAAARSEVERTRGTSCIGLKKKAICGSICRLRAQQARTARNFGLQSQNVSRQVSDIVADMAKKNYAAEEVRNAFGRINTLIQSDSFVNMQAWLQENSLRFKSSKTFFSGGRTFVCKDPQFARKLDKALKRIEDLTSLRVALPEPKDKVNLPDAARQVITKVWSEFVSRFEGNKTGGQFPAGFPLAAANDVFTTLFLLLDHVVRAMSGKKSRWDREFRLMGKEQLEKQHKLFVGLNLHQIDGLYFASPVDSPDPAVLEVCQDIVSRRKLKLHRTLKTPLPLGDKSVLSDWVAARGQLHGGANNFLLYKLERKHQKWMDAAARYLAV